MEGDRIFRVSKMKESIRINSKRLIEACHHKMSVVKRRSFLKVSGKKHPHAHAHGYTGVTEFFREGVG